VGSLGLALGKLRLKQVQAFLSVMFNAELALIVVEGSHALIVAIYEVHVKQRLHHSTTLVLCQAPNHISSQKRHMLDSYELIEQCHDDVWIGPERIFLKVFQVGADERLFLVLTEKHIVAGVFWHWQNYHR